jgi:hypothetical protein
MKRLLLAVVAALAVAGAVAPAAWGFESGTNEFYGGCFWYTGGACQEVGQFNFFGVPQSSVSPTSAEATWELKGTTVGWAIAPGFRPHEAAWNQAVAEGKPMVNVWHGEQRSLLDGFFVVVETGPECGTAFGRVFGPCEPVTGYLLTAATHRVMITNLKPSTKYLVRIEEVVQELPWAPAEGGSVLPVEMTTPKAPPAPLRARSRTSR